VSLPRRFRSSVTMRRGGDTAPYHSRREPIRQIFGNDSSGWSVRRARSRISVFRNCLPKSMKRITFPTLALCLALTAISSQAASTKYWDNNAATTGAGGRSPPGARPGGSGRWSGRRPVRPARALPYRHHNGGTRRRPHSDAPGATLRLNNHEAEMARVSGPFLFRAAARQLIECRNIGCFRGPAEGIAITAYLPFGR